MNRYRLILLASAVLAASAVTYAQDAPSNFDKWWTPQTDALVAAPQHHKVIFENDEVRVLEVTIQPGVTEPMHAHRYPSVLYLISSAHLIEHTNEAPPADRGNRPDGMVTFLPIGPPHALQNIDTKPLKAIRVELKKER